jgi:LysR family transcriptional regulator, transcriptional activator of nhaA
MRNFRSIARVQHGGMAVLPELNYHHLRAFWAVAREGSITKACVLLRVSQPTISEQLRSLAKAMGAELFVREGRRLQLTDTGRLMLDYADEIFALGRELRQTLGSRTSARAIPVVVGISDAVSKLIASRLIAPALLLADPVQVTVQEDRHEVLLQQLAAHALDLVISEAPLEPHLRIRAYNHLLGESPLAVFGASTFAKLARGFPRSLDGAPLLAGLPTSPQRRAWDAWCANQGVQPRVVAQVQDSALLKTMGQAGFGVFAGPEVIADDLCRTFGVRIIGRIPELRLRHYAISIERRLSNPALLAITSRGRDLFTTR